MKIEYDPKIDELYARLSESKIIESEQVQASMIQKQSPQIKREIVAGQSNLKDVAGMLHRPSAKKLSDRQLKQRITARLRHEDQASKTKEFRKAKSL